MLASKYRWHRESKAAEERAVKKSTAQIINALAKALTPEQWERAVHAIADIGGGTDEACADALQAGFGGVIGPEPASGPDNCLATPETE
jgi:DNA-binding MurR/RpiR family transcriptional regulator